MKWWERNPHLIFSVGEQVASIYFTIKYYINICFFVDVIKLRMFSFIPSLLNVLKSWMDWIFVKCPSVSVGIITWFLSCSLFIWWIILIDFQVLNQLCLLEINTTWLWCIILFIYCLIQFTNFFENLCSWEILICSFLFT